MARITLCTAGHGMAKKYIYQRKVLWFLVLIYGTAITLVLASGSMLNPKVTIVGLLPMQANKIKSLYGDELNLQFITAETSPTQMQLTAESSDQVILMTKFIPHEAQTALRKLDLVYCNGGVSSLKLKLDAMLSL